MSARALISSSIISADEKISISFLSEKNKEMSNRLVKEHKNSKELQQELESIMESSYDGICITDEKGIIIKSNKNFLYLYGIKHDIVGSQIELLEEQLYAYPSVFELVKKEKRVVTFIQSIKNGRNLLITGSPIISDDNKISKIMVYARDFEEIEVIKNKYYCNLRDNNTVKESKVCCNVIAYSQKMIKVIETCRKVSRVDSTVMITGESGVGKEVLASFIHKNSSRKVQPYIKVNCGAIPDTLIESELFGYESGAFTGAKKEGRAGLFEMAHKGTIFLDEIGELPYNLQVKLLQVLQEKKLMRIGSSKPVDVDIRIIAATNRSLREMVDSNKFRKDLYYRLNVVPIIVPPLRERNDDIIPITNYYLDIFNKKYNGKKRLSRDVLQIFLGYQWPGNIRELINLVERLVVTSDKSFIEINDLPAYFLEQEEVNHNLEGLPYLNDAVENLEKAIITKAYKKYANSYKMGEVLGVNQSTIIRKMKKYGIRA